MNATEIQSGLHGFYGTQEWHRWSILFPKMLLTDGAKYLADKCEAYWFMDLIASYQRTALKDKSLQDIQFWTLRKNPKGSRYAATLICERDTGDIAIKQEIEFTDFPLDEIKLYVQPMGDGLYTILLPSEY